MPSFFWIELDQLKNLSLNRHVESRGRFIGDQQIRIGQ
jgi:hypothetical protein